MLRFEYSCLDFGCKVFINIFGFNVHSFVYWLSVLDCTNLDYLFVLAVVQEARFFVFSFLHYLYDKVVGPA